MNENVQYGTARASSMNSGIVSSWNLLLDAHISHGFLRNFNSFVAVYSEQLIQLKHEKRREECREHLKQLCTFVW